MVSPDVAERFRYRVACLLAALDASDADDFVNCFTPDGCLYATGRGITRGREALRAYIERTAPGRPVHVLTSDLRITQIKAEVSARAPFALINAGSGALDARGDLVATAEIRDGRYEFSSVRFAITWASGPYRASGRCAVEGDPPE